MFTFLTRAAFFLTLLGTSLAHAQAPFAAQQLGDERYETVRRAFYAQATAQVLTLDETRDQQAAAGADLVRYYNDLSQAAVRIGRGMTDDEIAALGDYIRARMAFARVHGTYQGLGLTRFIRHGEEGFAQPLPGEFSFAQLVELEMTKTRAIRDAISPTQGPAATGRVIVPPQ